jgi:hypothetical protein
MNVLLLHEQPKVVAWGGGDIMKNYRLFFALLFVTALASLCGAPAFAQATRTWVSGVGDDANPCSRTAPCKTFAGAISKTAAGGEINCTDPGGFGGVTITKAITIDCEDVEAGVLVAGTNAIVVNAGVNDVVVLRGLDIEGLGTGLNGIRFLAGAALHVHNCVIRNFAGGSPNGNGIIFAPATVGELFVTGTFISRSGTGTTGAGIQIQPSGAGGAKVVLDDVHVENNIVGIRTDASTSTGGINLMLANSSSSGNTFHGVVAISTGVANNVMVDNSSMAQNAQVGVRADGSGVTIRISNSNITGNGTGTQIAGAGVISSYGNNHIDGNTANGPNPPTIPER